MLLLTPMTRLPVVGVRPLMVLTMFCTDIAIDAACMLVGSMPTLIDRAPPVPV